MTQPEAFDALLTEIADRVAERLPSRSSGEYVYEDELVAALGSRDKAKRLVKSGTVDGSVVGRKVMAKRSSFYAYLESQRVRRTDPTASPKPSSNEDAISKVFRTVR